MLNRFLLWSYILLIVLIGPTSNAETTIKTNQDLISYRVGFLEAMQITIKMLEEQVNQPPSDPIQRLAFSAKLDVMINQYKKYYSANNSGVNPANYLVDGKFNDLEMLIKNHIKDISAPVSEKDLENKERKYFSALSELFKNFLDGIQDEINDPRDVVRNSAAHLKGQSLGFSLGLNFLNLFIGSEIHLGTDSVRNRIVTKTYISSVEKLMSLLRQSDISDQESFLSSNQKNLLRLVENYFEQLKVIESTMPGRRPWFFNVEHDQKILNAAIQIDRLRKTFSGALVEFNQLLPNQIVGRAPRIGKAMTTHQDSETDTMAKGVNAKNRLHFSESEIRKGQCLKFYFGLQHLN
jgi:hypothetical protein